MQKKTLQTQSFAFRRLLTDTRQVVCLRRAVVGVHCIPDCLWDMYLMVVLFNKCTAVNSLMRFLLWGIFVYAYCVCNWIQVPRNGEPGPS